VQRVLRRRGARLLHMKAPRASDLERSAAQCSAVHQQAKPTPGSRSGQQALRLTFGIGTEYFISTNDMATGIKGRLPLPLSAGAAAPPASAPAFSRSVSEPSAGGRAGQGSPTGSRLGSWYLGRIARLEIGVVAARGDAELRPPGHLPESPAWHRLRQQARRHPRPAPSSREGLRAEKAKGRRRLSGCRAPSGEQTLHKQSLHSRAAWSLRLPAGTYGIGW
jgi:hypothetical protein